VQARRAAAAEARKPTVTDIDGGETSESSTTTDKDRHEDSLDKGDVFNQLEELFSAVMMAKDIDDRPLHSVFQLIPSRKKYPSYYEIIDNPIDLKMIAMKIQGGMWFTFATKLLMTKISNETIELRIILLSKGTTIVCRTWKRT